MKELNFINLNQLTWPLNVAIMGLVFSVFSLIYNTFYIHYGLITIAFGILGHIFILFYEWLFKISEDNKYINVKKYWIAHATNIILFALWIRAIVGFYYF